MHNVDFIGFTCFRAQGTNLNFGWGSIQEWGCIQADTVSIYLTKILFHLPLATVLEVIELGISGTKSQSKTTEPVVMKDKKISQPASRRVRDAAESLLCSLMEQVDFYTVHCGAESLSSTIGKSKV